MNKDLEALNKAKKGNKPAQGPKRGPGRPKNPPVITQTSNNSENPNPQGPEKAQEIKMDMKPILVRILDGFLPYNRMAKHYERPDLAVSQDDLLALAGDIEHLANYYMPKQIDPIYLVWASLGVKTSMIFVTRQQILNEIKEKPLKTEKPAAGSAQDATA